MTQSYKQKDTEWNKVPNRKRENETKLQTEKNKDIKRKKQSYKQKEGEWMLRNRIPVSFYLFCRKLDRTNCLSTDNLALVILLSQPWVLG